MNHLINSLFYLGFGVVYAGLGRLLFGRDFGTPSNQTKKWKLVLLGFLSLVVGFGVFVLLMSMFVSLTRVYFSLTHR